MAYKPAAMLGVAGGIPKKSPTTSYADMIRNNQVSLFGNSSVPQTSAPQRQTAIKPKLPPTAGTSVNTGVAGVTSGVNNNASYNNIPTDNWTNQLTQGSNQSFNPNSNNSYTSELSKRLSPTSSGPKLPEQINLDNYRTEMTTIRDLEKKYGFDYSRDYAERQAEVLAQAQRDAIESARERAQYETESAQVNLEHDFFNQYLQQRQGMADTGLNAGIAAERDLRLGMDRQHAMADILANAQLYNQELDRNAATIDKEELAYAEQLFNDRLAQAFGMSMDASRFEQSENQFQAQAQMQQRQQLVEEAWREYEFNNMSKSQREQLLQSAKQHGDEMAWREYEFNNMSASEKARLKADADKFGMEMAWQRHKFEVGMAFEASGNFTSGSEGGGKAFSSFKQTSRFGTRKDPITGKTASHGGNDYAMPVGTPVVSNVSGKVVRHGVDKN